MGNNKANDFYEAIGDLEYFFPTMIDLLSKKAKYQREHYNQLVKEGFGEKEALEIVKAQKTPWE